jgi:hypothetical protein
MQLSDGGHLHAGQDGIADAGQRSGGKAQRNEVPAQGQRGNQGEQAQREEVNEADRGRDVQATDGKEVSEARAAHRLGILLQYRALVAGRKRCGDAALACRKL